MRRASGFQRGPSVLAGSLLALGAVAGVAVLVVHPSRPHLLVAGVGAISALPPMPASPTSTVTVPAAAVEGSGLHLCLPASSGAPPTCVAATYAAGILQVGATKFTVGRAGDVLDTGRWSCGAAPTVALLRPSTGEIWVFTTWPAAGQPVTARPVAQVPTARGLAARTEGACDAIVVRRADGSETLLEAWRTGARS